MINDFSQWLLEEIDKREMTNMEVAQRGGISHSRISQVLAGEQPGRKVCRAIARAFNLPPEDVFRRAGLLPPAPDDGNLSALQALHLFRQLPDDMQTAILTQMDALVEEQRRQERKAKKRETAKLTQACQSCKK